MKKLQKIADSYSSAGSGFSARTSNNRTTSLAAISRQIISTVFNGYQGNVAVQLWDGNQIIGNHNAPCCIIFHDPGSIRELILYRSVSRLTEAYLDGAISVNGNMETLFDVGTHFKTLHLPWIKQWHLIRLALKLPRRRHVSHKSSDHTTHKNGRASIAHHYDVSNEFYRLWLDPQMVYSCAYFSDEQQSLDEAQREKLDYLCRKLRLQPGQTLLDIGCGWGALAIHAARYYGVTVHGITLSKAQQKIALERIRNEGLQEKVKIELCDYRDLPEKAKYDRVVSVGMFEHVGLKNFPTYFGTVKRVLNPGGLFLNHGITSETRWRRTPVTRFINRYIFPDGELTRVSEVTDAMEKAGFEILDTEGLRRHYTYTLRHWVKALEENYNKAVQQTSEVTYRLWRLYMAGSAYFFNEGNIGVYQLLVGHQHDPIEIPLRRDDLYHSGSTK
ncbi:MAG: C17 cyclopropane fatty acid synthase CfaB [Gammaproteobacteria bacterium]|nr:MAG: C17 cyclopropane fatty acid synthase CfaB [Gammaproteobacteria bacterium]